MRGTLIPPASLAFLALGWPCLADDITSPIVGFWKLTGTIVSGATPAKNSALVSEGAELRLAHGVVLLAKFDGEFASHSSTYAGTGTVRYTW